MCGVLGVLGQAEPRSPVRASLESLRHRGPDSHGWRSLDVGDQRLMLGHTRLRIVDLSPEADQPLTNEDGTIWVNYNGELYNHVELRAELEAAGHHFRSRSDTECLVHLYEACEGEPEAMLTQLRGMFAFALADLRRGRLLLARDRLGIKPLYYAEMPGNLVFASEVRALLRTGLVPIDLDPEALRGYLYWGVVPGPHTIARGVRELPAGSFLLWQGARARLKRWWTPDPEPEAVLGPDASRLMAAALADAVRRHLVADRPVGLFLSGGLDSGSVARFASSEGEIRSLTVTFPDDPRDEAVAARAWAVRFGLRHEEVPVSGSDVGDSLNEFLASMDQPTSDGVNTWIVSRAAREAGLVVALSGLGGDELFGGYPTFRLVPRVRAAAGLLNVFPKPPRLAAARAAGTRRPGGRLSRVFTAPRGWEGAYQAVRGLFSPAELPWLGEREEATDGAPSANGMAGLQDSDAVTLLELHHYLASQLLRDTDHMSMAHSLEVRVPLLDDAVVRLALALPGRVRVQPHKALLARAAGIEPRSPKRPFTLPFGRWLRGPLRQALEEGLLSEGLPFAKEAPRNFRRRLFEAFDGGRVHWSRPWAVAVLRLWPAANGLRL